jgi:hypothetical protein
MGKCQNGGRANPICPPPISGLPLRKLARYGKPKAQLFRPLHPCCVRAPSPIKHLAQILWRNADTTSRNYDHNLGYLRRLRVWRHRAAQVKIAQGVVQQAKQKLPQPRRVGPSLGLGQITRGLAAQHRAALRSPVPHPLRAPRLRPRQCCARGDVGVIIGIAPQPRQNDGGNG